MQVATDRVRGRNLHMECDRERPEVSRKPQRRGVEGKISR